MPWLQLDELCEIPSDRGNWKVAEKDSKPVKEYPDNILHATQRCQQQEHRSRRWQELSFVFVLWHVAFHNDEQWTE